MNMSFYYKGLELSSATLASTMSNIIPAVTFLMAATIGMERVEIGSVRSMAKVLGTMVCVCGAFMMVFLKGKKLLNSNSSSGFGRMIWSSVLEATGDHNWLMGFFFLLGSSTCCSTWLILQVQFYTYTPSILFKMRHSIKYIAVDVLSQMAVGAKSARGGRSPSPLAWYCRARP
ncbi:WAT1-related protein [Platanthera guangdongensis]|uniref:WAT1-related protein n=1 Tax=Platanthera guangdongensis TaxID=2320717 RepID=A0ABR2LY06_9ASPA